MSAQDNLYVQCLKRKASEASLNLRPSQRSRFSFAPPTELETANEVARLLREIVDEQDVEIKRLRLRDAEDIAVGTVVEQGRELAIVGPGDDHEIESGRVEMDSSAGQASRPSAARLPYDVLERIFVQVQQRHMHDLCAPKALHPLLLVNKHWHECTEAYIYTHVFLDDDQRCQLLRRTLKEEPRLAWMVRQIRMATTWFSEEEASARCAIIRLCPNVHLLHFEGWSYERLDELRAAISTQKGLVTLLLNRNNLGDEPGTRFGDHSEVTRLLAHLPNLRTLVIACDAFGQGTGDEEEIRKTCEGMGITVYHFSQMYASGLHQYWVDR